MCGFVLIIIGCHLRDRLFEENPELLPPTLRARASASGTMRHHAVYLFLDKSQPLCCTNKFLLLSDMERNRSGTIDSSNSTSTWPLGKGGDGDKRLQLQRDILLHILDMDFHVRDKSAGSNSASPGESFLDLGSKDEERVVHWLERALLIVERAKTLPVVSDVAMGARVHAEVDVPGGLAKLYRESYLGSLLAEICPDRRFSPRRSNSLLTETVEGDADAGVAAAAVSEIPPPPDTPLQPPVPFGQQAPNIPDISFRVFDVDPIDAHYVPDSPGNPRDTIETSKKYSGMRNSSGYVQVFQDTDEIMRMMSEALTAWQVAHGSSAASGEVS